MAPPFAFCRWNETLRRGDTVGSRSAEHRRPPGQDGGMAVPATGAPTPPAAVTLGRLIGRALLALLRATPLGRWLEREFLASGHVRRAEKNGYRFWGPVVAAILLTEVLGALADWLHRRTILEIKWPTISSTVGQIGRAHV